MKKPMQRAGPSTITVSSEDADRRLDNFLMTRLKGVPRSRVYRMIRSGEVRINGGRARPDSRIQRGDAIRIPPVYTHRTAAKPKAPDSGAWIEACVVYEDSDVLVLNKPAGLAAHGGSGISSGAIELLRAARGDRQSLGLVHRLDRATSGCLLIAKRRAVLRKLHECFREGDVHKHYKGLLLGSWPGGNRIVTDPLLTTRRRGGERHVRVDPRGKTASTRFIPEEQYQSSQLTKIELGTGRTHQIRVHAAHIGHPVAGDSRYGPARDPVAIEFQLGRLFLHAESLVFESPKGDRVIRVECPMDDELAAVLAKLRAEKSAG
jgi:23S rRNA pseudouridine955/2504/2580 synthase